MKDPYRIVPDTRVRLSKFDPADTGGMKDADEAGPKMHEDLEALRDLQELLYAARTHAVLIVLQGIDTAGKDGTIRHVFRGVNPQSCRVASFKVPTPEEAAHDFLWRVHRETPARGEIAIFNRSHYESVLVERVHRLAPEKVWRRRYREIREFEAMLANSGTIVLKFFLNISKREQKRRLDARMRVTSKRWKLNPEDWKERELWRQYQDAFNEMLSKTSTDLAPWYVVPSDVKWYRNLVVADRITEALQTHQARWKRAVRELGKASLRALFKPGRKGHVTS